jgi:predicted nucleic acid-binding protein
MLVIDASAAFAYALSPGGYEPLLQHAPIAPALMWSEALSALHETQWRGDEDADVTAAAIERLLTAPIERIASRELYAETRRVSLMLRWAKTYDAEYLALARLHDCRLLSLDIKLHRGARGLAVLIGPADL